jgi:4-methylaminobutanoate oxidase (formaldehyde-forming)
VLAQKARGPLTRRLMQVLVTDPEPLMFHAEVVCRNGRPAGYIRSASYGFTLGGAVGLAMIDADEPINQAYLDSGEWTVQIGTAVYPAVTSLRPMYDPQNKRIRM